jgi:hypothetical protein
VEVRRKPQHRGVAQPGRALGSGPRGRRFKSCLPDFVRPLDRLASANGPAAFFFFSVHLCTHRGTPRPTGNGGGPLARHGRFGRQGALVRRQRRERHRELRHRPALVLHVEVAVGHRRELRVQVPEDALDELKRDSGLEEQGRRGVAQVVQADVPRDRLRPEAERTLRAATGLRVLLSR